MTVLYSQCIFVSQNVTDEN